jgi:hypothetical protein
MAKAKPSILKPLSRQVVEAQIDILIDMLNGLDGDPDAEPSIGWPDSHAHPLQFDVCANANAGDDREEEDEREPGVDDEPSLGWTHTVNQGSTDWAANHIHGATDLEEGVAPVRKKRAVSKTGNRVVVGWCAEVLL